MASTWSTYIVHVELCVDYTDFAEWNGAQYIDPDLGVYAPVQPNIMDAQGRWHKVSTWVMDENRAAFRQIYAVPLHWNAGNEEHEISLGDIGTGDTFTLTIGGETTGSISYAADMTSAIETALEALAAIPDGVYVTKTTGQAYVVSYGGTLASSDVPMLSITNVAGFTPASNVVDVNGIGAGDTFTLTVGADTTAAIAVASNLTVPITNALAALPSVAAAGGIASITKTRGEHRYHVLTNSGSALVITVTPTGFTPVAPSVWLLETANSASPMPSRFRFEFNSSKGSVTDPFIGPWIGYGRYVAILKNYALVEGAAPLFTKPVAP
jgi:hypothetical protein